VLHGTKAAAQQNGNNCGVVASFTPSNDSVVSSTTQVILTSNSTNATTYSWFINGSPTYNNTNTLYYYFQTGLYEIMLVASNGNCSDTARATYFCPGIPAPTDSISFGNYGFSQTDETPYSVDDTREGGFVIGGISSIFDAYSIRHDRPYIVKTKPSGCVEWSLLTNDLSGGTVDCVFGCADSSVMVSGSYYAGGGPYLARFDKAGNPLWQHKYLLDGNPILIRKMAEESDGTFYVLAAGEFLSNGFQVVKLNAAGDVLWAKVLYFSQSPQDYNVPGGIIAVNGQVYVCGTAYFNNWPNPSSTAKCFMLRIDGASGNTIWSKQYKPPTDYAIFEGVKRYGSRLLVSAIASPYNHRLGHSLAVIDEQGNFQKGATVLHGDNYDGGIIGYFSALNGYAEADSAKEISLLNFSTRPLSLQPYSATSSYFLKLDSSFKFKWGYTIGGRGTYQFTQAALNREGAWGSIAYNFGLVTDGIRGSGNFQLLKIKGPKDSPSCIAYTDAFDIMPLQYTSVAFNPEFDSAVQLSKQSINIPLSRAYSESRFACPDFIASCSVITVTGPTSVCNLSQTYTYKAFRNKKCNLPVKWEIQGPVTVVEQSDSLIKVRFLAFGNSTISALLASSCSPVKDSVVVTAASRTPPLELGGDQLLCPGNSVRLSAGPKFINYRWQDGSIDSILMVTRPGKYWVRVTDSCSNEISDTVVVSMAPPIPFTVGPDRTKCNADRIHLNAPAGFLNYTWSHDYNISSLTGQNVVVNPLVDTAYYIKAEKTPGCFAYDTVRIKVYHSPPIKLGADRNLCFGDSTVFDAGAGFQQYTWSKGQTTQVVVIKDKGSCSVVGTTADGCKSYDTVVVLNIYPLPMVHLDKGSGICFGDSKTLDAGSFASYQWSTGATSRSITVNGIGQYAVMVTDVNGCKGSDTTAIDRIYPLPADFLPADTAICSYGMVELKPHASFSRYLWSTGAGSPSIIISQPGRYWLEVTDLNACPGRDTVLVNPKQCMAGFYIPSAFSPNGDGKNDLFRPLLFGRVKQYSFTIYNRWGAVVFQTSEVGKGWTGKAAGTPQETSVFVWTCTYQFEGGEVKTEKGTVTVLR
jgi:gliding motility-associated-like protein